MRKQQSSMTAQGIAIVRGIESEKPPGERLVEDPFARQFVNDWLYRLVRFFDRLGWSERKGPGVMGFLVTREAHIDAWLEAEVAAGAQQVVLLGAGLDARAYRIAALRRVRVFEVDHPASQRTKLAKVRQALGALPPHVTYVALDFQQDSLAARLTASGYRPDQRTVFIWQGVTQYLTPPAVDATLAFIATQSAPGSSVIFDYIYPTLLDGTLDHGEVRNMRARRWFSGEMLEFGIPEGTVTDFLTARGLCAVVDTPAAALAQRYGRAVADGYAIAAARVGG